MPPTRLPPSCFRISPFAFRLPFLVILLPLLATCTRPNPIYRSDQLVAEDPALAMYRSDQLLAADHALHDRLNLPLAECTAHAQPFAKVLRFLSETQGIPFTINWPALAVVGVTPQTPITLDASNVPLSRLLQDILTQASPNHPLGFLQVDRAVAISTPADLATPKYAVIRVYDIRDFLPEDPRHTVSFDPALAGKTYERLPNPRPRDDVLKDITSTITSTVAPESWRQYADTIAPDSVPRAVPYPASVASQAVPVPNSDPVATWLIPGAIQELRGQLFITQTVENHFAIQDLFAQLRETRALRIQIEIQAYLIAPATLAALQDLIYNQPPAGGGIPSIPPATAPGGATTLPSSFPFADMGLAYIPNPTQLSAAQKTLRESHSFLLIAARPLAYNGETTRTGFVTGVPFVSAYRPQTNPRGQTDYVPVQSIVRTGLIIKIESTVSADRRYVVLKVDPDAKQIVRTWAIPAPGTPPGLHLATLRPVCAGLDYKTPATAPATPASTRPFGGGLSGISYTGLLIMASIPDAGTLLYDAGEYPEHDGSVDIGAQPASEPPGPHLLLVIRPKITIPPLEEPRPSATLPTPDRLLEQRLDAELPELYADHQPLAEVFAAFTHLTQIPVEPDWPALARCRLTPQTPVNFHAAHLTARSTLTALLDQITPAAVTYRVRDSAILIFPQE